MYSAGGRLGWTIILISPCNVPLHISKFSFLAFLLVCLDLRGRNCFKRKLKLKTGLMHVLKKTNSSFCWVLWFLLAVRRK